MADAKDSTVAGPAEDAEAAPADGPTVTLLDDAERRRIVDMVFDDAEHADVAGRRPSPQFPLGLGRTALNIGAISIRYLKNRDIAFMDVEALKTALAQSDFPVHAAILSGLAASPALYKIKVERGSCECEHERRAVETFLQIVAPLKSRLRVAREMQVPQHNAFFVRHPQFVHLCGANPGCLGENEHMILPLDSAMLGTEVNEVCDLLGDLCWPHVRAYIESMQDHQSVGTF